MVKLLTGGTGSGKSKKLIEMANEAVKEARGNIIFVDDDNRNIHELDQPIRFINLEEYFITNLDQFYGFISGLLSGNYDIETIFVDGLDNFSQLDPDSLDRELDTFEKIAKANEVDLILCFNGNVDNLSERAKQILI